MKTPTAIAKGTITRVRGAMFRTEETGKVTFECQKYPHNSFTVVNDPGVAFGCEWSEVVAEVDLADNVATFLYEIGEGY